MLDSLATHGSSSSYRVPDYDYSFNGNVTVANEGVQIWFIIAAILAIIGGILLYFLFVKSKTEPKNKFAKWLKDFLNFKIMWIESILKVVYYISTIFIMLFSFSFFRKEFWQIRSIKRGAIQ